VSEDESQEVRLTGWLRSLPPIFAILAMPYPTMFGQLDRAYGKESFVMNDIGRLFQAFLAPVIFVSATALLILSINVRLMGIVSRLRQFVHARHDAANRGSVQEAEAYTAQIESIERRAETMRRCFLLALVALAGTLASCLLLGLGLYIQPAALVAVMVFVLALMCLLVASIYYGCEVRVALSSVQEEARDLRFMDLGTHREHEHRDSM
jgi:Protein of unknown function (DUF2721)